MNSFVKFSVNQVVCCFAQQFTYFFPGNILSGVHTVLKHRVWAIIPF